MTQRKPLHMTADSFAERLTREAIEQGKFDQLPGFGEPLPGIDEPYDENRWVREKLQRESVQSLPPGLAPRKRVAEETTRILALTEEAEVRQQAEALNQVISHENMRITYGPPANVMPVDVEEVVTRWKVLRSTS